MCLACKKEWVPRYGTVITISIKAISAYRSLTKTSISLRRVLETYLLVMPAHGRYFIVFTLKCNVRALR